MYLANLYEKLENHEPLSLEQLELLESELSTARDILKRAGPVFKLAAQELEYRVLHVKAIKETQLK